MTQELIDLRTSILAGRYADALAIVDELEGMSKQAILRNIESFLVRMLVHLINSILEPKEYFELRDKGIKSVIEGLKVLATIFGGIAILGNLFYAAKRAKALDASALAANATAKAALENAKAALKNAEAAQDKQITERFTKAVEQLASREITVRLGGIYALERIAKNSKDDHWTIMEVLTAFVREPPPLEEKKTEGKQPQQKLRIDIQAALTVIGQRNYKNETENQKLDLHNTNLQTADLREAILKGALLYEGNLQRANLQRANLQAAVLDEANLQFAILWEANLQKAGLLVADLQWANFEEAELQGAFLYRAKLQGAKFFETNLEGADLSEANLNGADLSGAKNLKQEQIEKAFGNKNTTRLPENLKVPEHWTESE